MHNKFLFILVGIFIISFVSPAVIITSPSPSSTVNIFSNLNLTNLSQLQDTDIPSPSNAEALIWNSTTSKWESQPITSAGDTNESTRFGNLVGNCSASEQMFGVNSDGSKVCVTDATGSGTDSFAGNVSSNFTVNMIPQTNNIFSLGQTLRRWKEFFVFDIFGRNATLSDSLHLTSLTKGSVLFIGDNGLVSEDNNNFFYNSTTMGLALGGTNVESNIGGVIKNSILHTHSQGGGNAYDLIFHRHSATSGTFLAGLRSRGSEGSEIIVQDGDNLLDIFGIGYDGTDYEFASSIMFDVDGTPGNDNMPGRIVFLTTPNGSTTLVEAMRINQDGNVNFSNNITISGNYISNGTAQFSFQDFNTTIPDTTIGNCSSTGSCSNIVYNNTGGWTVNLTNAVITNLFTPQNNLHFNFYDDGSDIIFNVTSGGGDFVIEQDNAKIVLHNTPNVANDFKVFHVFSKEASDVTEFVVTKQISELTSYFVASLSIAGNSTSTPTPYNCSTYTDHIDCRTDLTGADLYVQDDIEIDGELFVDGTGESLISGSLNVTGNVTASFFFGDGSQLSNLPSSDNSSFNQSLTDTLYSTGSHTTIWDTLFNNTLTNFLTTWFSGKTTDDLSEGTINLYDNVTWNQTGADLIYADISVTGDNSSWNQSLADTLYADISVVDTDTQKTTNGFYLYNDSTTIFYNETQLNNTIDNRDSDTFVNANCPAGQFVQNISGGNTLECATASGGGDITGVNGDDIYIYNGSASGEITLIFNETKLNLTIDDRASGLGDNESWNESLANTLYSTGSHIGNCSVDNSCGLITYDSELSYTTDTQKGTGNNLVYNDSTLVYGNYTEVNNTIISKVTQTFIEAFGFVTGSHTIIWDSVFNSSGDSRWLDDTTIGNCSSTGSCTNLLYNSDLPLANQTTPHCSNITGATSDLCSITGGGDFSFTDFQGSFDLNISATEGSLNVNNSNYWDNMNSINSTQMEDNGGVLNILESWLSSFFDTLFGTKDTDDLSEGSTNKYAVNEGITLLEANITDLAHIGNNGITLVEANITDLTHTTDTTIGNCSVSGSCSNVAYMDYTNIGDFNVSLNVNVGSNITIPEDNRMCLDGIACTKYITYNGSDIIIFG